VRSTGLDVELTVEGSPRDLPPGIDLSAYRIVQEALTNTLKHAQASTATVLVKYGADAVEVHVVDDGRGSGNGGERGQGIIGMRERAALFGGQLRAGPAPNRGFSVYARIPLEGDGA
jgi:signal transduction histidine kinase